MLPPKFLTQLLPKAWLEQSRSEKALFKAFISYAAGDAFGAFYEFNGIPQSVPNQLKAKSDWPLGGISDDTMLTVLTLRALEEEDPDTAALKFLELLKQNAKALRGLGPTTRMALGLEVKANEVASVGATNGGLMRTCLAAMAFAEKERRDRWLRALVFSTHKSEIAIRCAIELGDLIHDRQLVKGAVSLASFPGGVSNSSEETLRAVKAILSVSENLNDVFLKACALGGDTDTTAAVSSAIFSFWHSELDEIFSIPWLSEVNWSEVKEVPSALQMLYRRAIK